MMSLFAGIILKDYREHQGMHSESAYFCFHARNSGIIGTEQTPWK